MVTVKMESEGGSNLGVEACYGTLFNYWAPRISDDVKTMRPFADGTGCAFDIRSSWIDGFLDNFMHLSSGGKRLNFSVSRAKSLPECGEDVTKEEPAGDEDMDGGEDGRRKMVQVCFNCGNTGHKSMDCTEPKKEREGGGGGNRGCFNCGEEGHRADDCTEPKKEREQRGPMKCYNC